MRKVELICVTVNNNNKYYRMTELEDKTFKVEFGRVGYSSQQETYPISLWDKKYKEKIKKGYTDVSEYKKVITSDSQLTFPSLDVELWFNTFQQYTSKSVNNNYRIDVGVVTKAMIDDAQSIINDLLIKPNNDLLLRLYTILPRKIHHINDVLLKGNESEVQLKEKINKEQQVLDDLSSGVSTIVTENQSLSDLLGVNITDSTFDVNPVMQPTNKSNYKPFKVFNIEHKSRTLQFNNWLSLQSNKKVELLIHGTRNPNIFSILKQGLIIRPTNAIISGNVYGDGIYHSAHTSKSLGYTGHDSDKTFLLQQVHMGNSCEYKGWYRDGKGLSRSEMNYKSLQQKGFDSLYVSAGDGLMNSEYIVYNQEQTNTNYLVWMK